MGKNTLDVYAFRLAILAGLLSALGLLGCQSCPWEDLQFKASVVASDDLEWDSASAALLGVPESIESRREAVVFLLEKAEGCSGHYRGSYRMLGEYLLSEDCEEAKRYLEMHIERVPDDDSAKGILERVRTRGCGDAEVHGEAPNQSERMGASDPRKREH